MTESSRFIGVGSPGVDVDRVHPIRPVVGAQAERRIREPLSAHLSDASAVEAFVPLPPAWLALRQSWAALTLVVRPCRDQLVDAVLTGGGDVGSLYAQALAEESATQGERAEVMAQVAARVHGELSALYAPAARSNYTKIAALFDAAAGRADYHALDELVIVLSCAARLCGADQDVAQAATHRLGLGLTVDPRAGHLRRIAEAFTRADRWQAVAELGGRIRAAGDPLTDYPVLPQPIRCVDGDRRLQWWDPLDGRLPDRWAPVLDGWAGDPSPSLWV